MKHQPNCPQSLMDEPFNHSEEDCGPCTCAVSVSQELTAAAQAVVERWDTPLWKDVAHTGEFIARLRDAIIANDGGNCAAKPCPHCTDIYTETMDPDAHIPDAEYLDAKIERASHLTGEDFKDIESARG